MLKIHTSSFNVEDLRCSWENPFLFYDVDDDGLSEMAIRLVDKPIMNPGERYTVALSKHITDVRMSFDLDNDNGPGNEFDFDMSLKFMGDGFDYSQYVHKYEKMSGLPASDTFFYDPRWRKLKELIYVDHAAAYKAVMKGKWKECWFVFDEDDDCERWERVEFYDPKDPFKVGAKYYQGWQGWRNDADTIPHANHKKEPETFPTIKYMDTDNNGFFDKIEFDLDGDQKFERTVSLKELGIDDKEQVVTINQLNYKGYRKLLATAPNKQWLNAIRATKVAAAYNITTSYYSFYKHPKSLQEKYLNGYWLSFLIYTDLRKLGEKNNDQAFLQNLDKAYFSGNWDLVH